MEPRETKTFETPTTKSVFIVYTYLLGREKRVIQSNYLNSDKQGRGEVLANAQDLGVKSLVVSINGHKEGDTVGGKPFSIVDYVLDMRADESKFVFEEINKIVKGDDDEEKKTS